MALGISEPATNCADLALVLARLIGNAVEGAKRLERNARDGELDDRVGLRLVLQLLRPRVHTGPQVLRGDRNERGLCDRAPWGVNECQQLTISRAMPHTVPITARPETPDFTPTRATRSPDDLRRNP